MTRDRHSRGWLEAVDVGYQRQLGDGLAVLAPLLRVSGHTVTLQHAELLQVRQVDAQAVISGRPCCCPTRTVAAHARLRRLIEIIWVNTLFKCLSR